MIVHRASCFKSGFILYQQASISNFLKAVREGRKGGIEGRDGPERERRDEAERLR
jgi:hypothetical protein